MVLTFISNKMMPWLAGFCMKIQNSWSWDHVCLSCSWKMRMYISWMWGIVEQLLLSNIQRAGVPFPMWAMHNPMALLWKNHLKRALVFKIHCYSWSWTKLLKRLLQNSKASSWKMVPGAWHLIQHQGHCYWMPCSFLQIIAPAFLR